MSEILTIEPGIPVTEELNMLQTLLEEEQFEVVEATDGLRIIYMMNDAVESFLVLENCTLTGTLEENYEGPLFGSVSRKVRRREKSVDCADSRGNNQPEKFDENVCNMADQDYVLVLHQGENVVTFFYQSLRKEVHLYNYARLGHFWVEGSEYLRQLEYHLAILRDKRDYLGEEYCNQLERKLAYLTEFPPLNYCSYPAASPAYVVPAYPRWQVSEEAFHTMEELAEEAGDRKMQRLLALYRRLPGLKIIVKIISGAFQKESHRTLTNLILQKMEKASAEYPDRVFTEHEKQLQQQLQNRAASRIRELESQGRQVTVLYEEPFTTSRDSIDFKIHLMVWTCRKGRRVTQVETFEL